MYRDTQKPTKHGLQVFSLVWTFIGWISWYRVSKDIPISGVDSTWYPPSRQKWPSWNVVLLANLPAIHHESELCDVPFFGNGSVWVSPDTWKTTSVCHSYTTKGGEKPVFLVGFWLAFPRCHVGKMWNIHGAWGTSFKKMSKKVDVDLEPKKSLFPLRKISWSRCLE